MNPLTLVKRIQNINSKEAALGISEEASWHAKYKGSAYVFAGGLPFDLTEGDLLAVFAQYGEIVDVNLVRDKGTGKSKGFAFIAYEDQRSTNLAVDNLNGAQILGRVIRVDHVSNYKKKEEEDEEELQRKREARGVCRAFQRGECTRGAACKFSHDEQRAANTGWGAEDTKWGHDKFDGPKRKESRFGDDFKDRVRNEEKGSRRYGEDETQLKSTEDRTNGRRQSSKHEDDEFKLKYRESDRERDDSSSRRHVDDVFKQKSGGKARREEEKRSQRHADDDDVQLRDGEESEHKSREKVYRGEERRSSRHTDGEYDLKRGGEDYRREERRSSRKEDDELHSRGGGGTPEDRREKRQRLESKPKDYEDRRVRDNRSAGRHSSSLRLREPDDLRRK